MQVQSLGKRECGADRIMIGRPLGGVAAAGAARSTENSGVQHGNTITSVIVIEIVSVSGWSGDVRS